MWNTNTLWFEVAVLSILFLLGHITFGHFEERTPRWRKILKFILFLAIVLSISAYFGRPYAFAFLGVMCIPVLYIHIVMLPKKGINGWTGEPKSKYYEFRGWSKDIFGKEDN